MLRTCLRKYSKAAYQEHLKQKNRKIVVYVTSVVVGMLGLTYASVPLYKVFCQATGFGGTTQRVLDTQENQSKMVPVSTARPIRIYFTGVVSDAMPWTFTPQQREVTLVPGETSLAFYTAKNPTSKPITGVATYNVYPPKAGLYFNKIQCFCFEEQRLNANEEIDMPVFFFIDPEILDDPAMKGVHNITLSYTFFKTDEV